MGDKAVEKEKKKHRWPKRVFVAAAAAAVVVCVGFGMYASDYYHAGDAAQQELITWENAAQAEGSQQAEDAQQESSAQTSEQNGSSEGNVQEGGAVETSNPNVAAFETNSSIAVGDANAEYGVVLYPGAKVEAKAYVPLACKLAEQGVYCVIAKMPLNFAFFKINAAGSLIEAAPNVQHWWLAGHSLGGAMGAMYVSRHTDMFEGIALLAAYSTANISESGLRVLTVYGSQDGVLNRDKLVQYQGNLPADAQTQVIEGGNHAGVADYGAQKGDGEATISADEQQSQTANAIVAAMKGEQASRMQFAA